MGAWGIFPDSLSIFGFRKLFKIAHPSAFINLDQGLRSFLKTKWADAINAPAHLHLVFANRSRTGTAGDDVGVQRDRAIPRQRPAFQIDAGGYCD